MRRCFFVLLAACGASSDDLESVKEEVTALQASQVDPSDLTSLQERLAALEATVQILRDQLAQTECTCSDDGVDTIVDTDEAPVEGPKDWFWVDAVGTVVTHGPDLSFIDSNGYRWRIDPNRTSPVLPAWSADETIYFEGASCTGRRILRIAADGAMTPFLGPDGTLLAQGPDLVPGTLRYSSRYLTEPGSCDGYASSVKDAVYSEDLTILAGVSPPTFSFTPPLRPSL